MKAKHNFYNVALCECDECVRHRKAKEERQRLEYERYAMTTFGPNWKNILSGLGDQ